MIKTLGLKKTYWLGQNAVRALRGVDLEISTGEMIAITGTSGSGKSTLMHILGCLDSPDEGRYLLDSEDVSDLSKDSLARTRNRKIGFVFQSFNLLPRISAVENVEVPLLYSTHSNSLHAAREALKTVGLADRMDHEPNQLSGGQRQRVAIARAIVTNPSIILADEPTGNLDSKTSSEILQLFHELHESGRTIIIVTHDDEVAAHCKRRIRMQDGFIKEDY